jgi:hypothetical protein
MEISNATQFAAFISKNNLNSLHPIFNQIVICMGEYSRACNCHNVTIKTKMYDACHAMYIQGINIAISNFKSKFLATTPERNIKFSNDGRLIRIMSM